MVAARFNRLMLEEMQVEQYFTMAYAEVDLATGQRRAGAGRSSASGDPARRWARSSCLGEGGLPVGLIAGAAL